MFEKKWEKVLLKIVLSARSKDLPTNRTKTFIHFIWSQLLIEIDFNLFFADIIF